jgi:hypothetical protein
MRYVSYLLEATIALVFIFGAIESLLGGSRSSARLLAPGSFGLTDSHAWVSGFGGSMGWDGDPPSRTEKREAK